MPETHDGLPVEGYRSQPGSNVDLVNVNKRIEEQVLRILDGLGNNPEVDKRWLAVGRTHLEQAWMAINRSIFKPDRVALPVDEAPEDDEIPF